MKFRLFFLLPSHRKLSCPSFYDSTGDDTRFYVFASEKLRQELVMFGGALGFKTRTTGRGRSLSGARNRESRISGAMTLMATSTLAMGMTVSCSRLLFLSNFLADVLQRRQK